MYECAKRAQKPWARTPLWKRAETLHRAAELMRQHAQPIADALVKEVAKPRQDSAAEVLRSADLMDYAAEEGVRFLGEGKLLTSDSFPGQDRTKLCLESRVRGETGRRGPRAFRISQDARLQNRCWKCPPRCFHSGVILLSLCYHRPLAAAFLECRWFVVLYRTPISTTDTSVVSRLPGTPSETASGRCSSPVCEGI